MGKVYVLREEFENESSIRETQILAVYKKIETAKKDMDKIIQKDEYGFIKEKGICVSGETYFETNFIDGFVAYAIEEHKVI